MRKLASLEAPSESIRLTSSVFSKALCKDPWRPLDYAANSSLQYQWAKSMMKRIPIKGNEILLDIGCGDGKITSELASLLPRGQAMGIDLSPSMIRYAQARFNKEQFPNLSFVLQDVLSINFQHCFDYVVSFTCLHWIKDQEAVLRGIKKSLKMGGKAYLSISLPIDSLMEQSIEEGAKLAKWQNHFIGFRDPRCFYPPERYFQFLHNAGLCAECREVLTTKEIFADSSYLIGWLRGWLPHRDRLSIHDWSDFIGDIVQLYLQKIGGHMSSPIPLICKRIEIEATPSS